MKNLISIYSNSQLKFIFLFSLLFCCFQLKSQSTISNNVIDSSSLQKLSYVNIGIRGKNFGTITDKEGAFQLIIPTEFYNETLTFSKIGFFEKNIPISDLINQKIAIVELNPIPIELNEISISESKNWKYKKSGLTRNLPGVYGEVTHPNLNDISECAQLCVLDSVLSNVISFHVFLKDTKCDTATFRINFYLLEDSLPGKRVVDSEILIQKRITNGWLEIDLRDRNIWLKGNVITSIEFLPVEKQKNQNVLYYGGILNCKGISHNRTSSIGNWEKLDFGTYSIYLKYRF